jgi:hypothetical protein
MCRLEDLIDNRPLLELIQSINSGDNIEFTTLLQNSLSPLVADSKFISFGAWKIDVTGTIYSRATAIEVTDGWKFLVNENVPLDIYIGKEKSLLLIIYFLQCEMAVKQKRCIL